MSADPTGMISGDAVRSTVCSVCGVQPTEECIPSDNEMEWGVHSDRIWDYRDACRKTAAKIAASRRSEK